MCFSKENATKHLKTEGEQSPNKDELSNPESPNNKKAPPRRKISRFIAGAQTIHEDELEHREETYAEQAARLLREKEGVKSPNTAET